MTPSSWSRSACHALCARELLLARRRGRVRQAAASLVHVVAGVVAPGQLALDRELLVGEDRAGPLEEEGHAGLELVVVHRGEAGARHDRGQPVGALGRGRGRGRADVGVAGHAHLAVRPASRGGPLDDAPEVVRVGFAQVVEAALGAARAAQVDHHDRVAARGEVAGQADRPALVIAGLGQDAGPVAIGEGAVVGAGLEDHGPLPRLAWPHDLDVEALAVGHRDVDLLANDVREQRLAEAARLRVVDRRSRRRRRRRGREPEQRRRKGSDEPTQHDLLPCLRCYSRKRPDR